VCARSVGIGECRSRATCVALLERVATVTEGRSRCGAPELVVGGMALLQRDGRLRARTGDGVDGGASAGKRGDARYARNDGGLPDRVAVAARVAALRCVDDEVETPATQQLDDGGALLDVGDGDAGRTKRVRGTGRC